MSSFIPGFGISPIQADPGQVSILPAEVRPLPVPTPDPGAVVPRGELPAGDWVSSDAFTVRPLPDFSLLPGALPGSPGIAIVVGGGSGDDVLALSPGGTAFGGGGADTFVLASAGAGELLENLGLITDFSDDDQLDLSGLGENAAILERRAQAGGRAEQITIDYDGDGEADGYVTVSGNHSVDFADYAPMPMPEPEFEPVAISLEGLDLGWAWSSILRPTFMSGWID